MRTLRLGLLVSAVAMFACGCASTKKTATVEGGARSPTATSHALLDGACQAADLLIAHPFPPDDEAPALTVAMGIQNRTTVDGDMAAIADTLVTRLVDAKRILLVDTARRDALIQEQGQPVGNLSENTKIAIGRSLGARYMLTGSVLEIRRTADKRETQPSTPTSSCRLTVEITDLDTGLVVVRRQLDDLRRIGQAAAAR